MESILQFITEHSTVIGVIISAVGGILVALGIALKLPILGTIGKALEWLKAVLPKKSEAPQVSEEDEEGIMVDRGDADDGVTFRDRADR